MGFFFAAIGGLVAGFAAGAAAFIPGLKALTPWEREWLRGSWGKAKR